MRRVYLGPDSPEQQAFSDRFHEKKAQSAISAKERKQMVSCLVSGGFQAVSGREYRVFEALSQGGIFTAGSIIVGSHAYSMMGNMLGIRLNTKDVRTQDIDIANDFRIHIGISSGGPLADILKQADDRFSPVPMLDRKSPSTSFSVRGAELRVDVITPMIGKTDRNPRKLSSINAMAEPVRFLDYLMVDIQPAVVMAGAGVLTHVPNPAFYAMHKLVLSQRRPVAMQAKIKKDIRQAAFLIQILNEARPGDLDRAIDAVADIPGKFSKQLVAGAKLLPDKTQAAEIINHLESKEVGQASVASPQP